MKKLQLVGSEDTLAREIVSVYLTHISKRLASDEISPGLAENYERDLGCYVDQFGEHDVRDLRQHDLTQFLQAHPSWKSVNTKRRCVAAVLACFRWARDEELIGACPYASPRALRGLIAETRRPATLEEFQTLMRVGSRPLQWALLFLYRTGCRTSEMRELQWESVRLDGREQPHLYLAKHKTFRKTGKPRIVGLDRLAVRLLRAIKRTSKSEFVFLNCDGQPWCKNTFCQSVRRTAIRAGLNEDAADRVTAYCLRHTYACDGIERGFTSSQVAHQLGHSGSEMVERVYAKHVGQRVGFISSVAVGIGRGRK